VLLRGGRGYKKLADRTPAEGPGDQPRLERRTVTDTRFVCSVCGTVFSDHRAALKSVDPEEDIACPNCGSAQLEPYEFDPDAPVVDPLRGPDEEGPAT
jgi:DNA-directed RNA polymerase subunit RPC12/RpoP